MSLPEPIVTLLSRFQSAFTAPTWQKMLTSLTGTLTSPRTSNLHGRFTSDGAGRDPSF